MIIDSLALFIQQLEPDLIYRIYMDEIEFLSSENRMLAVQSLLEMTWLLEQKITRGSVSRITIRSASVSFSMPTKHLWHMKKRWLSGVTIHSYRENRPARTQ